jgi:hypothetical protein
MTEEDNPAASGIGNLVPKLLSAAHMCSLADPSCCGQGQTSSRSPPPGLAVGSGVDRVKGDSSWMDPADHPCFV